MRIRGFIGGLAAAIVLLGTVAPAGANTPAEAVAKGLGYLRSTQKPDGSWSEYPAITALAVTAFLRNGRTEQNEPAVAKGVKFILRAAKPTGAICPDGNPSIALPNYNTCLCATALALTRNPAYKVTIDKARAFIEKSQFAEGMGLKPSNPTYGGIGYGDDPGDETHPDLSNLQMALEALHTMSAPTNAPVFKKALVYLPRAQNRRDGNDQPWARQSPNDGGFLYEAQGETKSPAGKHASYGAMTYAGLKSYRICGVPATDPRVRAAWQWISRHYTVAEHPGMGTASLYYYYRTMAATLDAYGEKAIRDAAGRPHAWARELSGRIAGLQRPNGSWVNSNAKYWEDRPELVTSYALIALAHCAKN